MIFRVAFLGILLQVCRQPLDEVLLLAMLREITFCKLLFEIHNAEDIERLPVELHGEIVDVVEEDTAHGDGVCQVLHLFLAGLIDLFLHRTNVNPNK